MTTSPSFRKAMRILFAGGLIAAAFCGFVFLESADPSHADAPEQPVGTDGETQRASEPPRARAGDLELRHIHDPAAGVCLTLVSNAFSGGIGTVRVPCTDKFIARAETAR